MFLVCILNGTACGARSGSGSRRSDGCRKTRDVIRGGCEAAGQIFGSGSRGGGTPDIVVAEKLEFAFSSSETKLHVA